MLSYLINMRVVILDSEQCIHPMSTPRSLVHLGKFSPKAHIFILSTMAFKYNNNFVFPTNFMTFYSEKEGLLLCNFFSSFTADEATW